MASKSSEKAHLVTLKTNALEIANSWVNKTSGLETEQSSEAIGIEFEGRPLRMGLGSKVSRYVEIAPSDDPVEKKLMGKLGVGKRHIGLNAGKKPSQISSESRSTESDEDESESRTSSFMKKSQTTAPSIPVLQKKKKRRANR